ncbi:isochorismatase family protein [Neptunomonas marina]|uniref:Isochorismatase family protein n=1 Tax=Neptunomonas marina TaxID=1815562 RepID=A0A437QE03_9GAMM|nr:isochorismatase family protein [Neptunomonas marina]RVU32802.1 isochorismatase family protein [Neptunomonas marina]
MTTTALLVIDVQESFKHRDYWNEAYFAQYQAKQNQLISHARQKGWEVIFVLHNEESGVFSPASGYVRLMDFLDKQADDLVFNKHVHNALLESGLHEHLQAQQITKLIISGIRTEQCCETTARVGSDLGYEIEFVVDATLTFPMHDPFTQQEVGVEEIKQRTCLVLNKRFATIRRTEEYAD